MESSASLACVVETAGAAAFWFAFLLAFLYGLSSGAQHKPADATATATEKITAHVQEVLKNTISLFSQFIKLLYLKW